MLNNNILGYEKLTIITFINARARGGEVGRDGSKKSKFIVVQPRGVRLKSHLMPSPPPLWDMKNLRMVKQGGTGQARQGKVAILTSNALTIYEYCRKDKHAHGDTISETLMVRGNSIYNKSNRINKYISNFKGATD